MWGAGQVHPRFAIRSSHKNDGELISGWADGTVGIQVGNLRGLLGPESTEVAYLLITAGREDVLTVEEPTIDAALLMNRLVKRRMRRLIERIARLADEGAGG